MDRLTKTHAALSIRITFFESSKLQKKVKYIYYEAELRKYNFRDIYQIQIIQNSKISLHLSNVSSQPISTICSVVNKWLILEK